MTLPTDIANLVLWLKGDAGVFTDAGTTPAVNNGDLIQQWNDQSGVGNHATQATSGNRPTLNTAGPNGRNAVNFVAASSKYFTLPNLFLGAAAGEIFFALKITNDPPTLAPRTGFCTIGADLTPLDAHFPYTDGAIYDSFGTANRKDVGNPTLSLSSTYRVYSTFSALNDWAAYLDQGLLFSTGSNVVAWVTAPTIGRSAGATVFFDGIIPEIVAFSRKLATAERLGVWDYLGVDRYALWTRVVPPIRTRLQAVRRSSLW